MYFKKTTTKNELLVIYSLYYYFVGIFTYNSGLKHFHFLRRGWKESLLLL